MVYFVKCGQGFGKGSIIGEHATEGEALNHALSIAPRWRDWETVKADKALHRWEDGPDFIEIVEQREAEE